MNYNIAIDGPAGAGKSTIAKKIAKKLGFIYVDTGAMYRAMAYFYVKNQINMEDDEAMNQLCEQADITIAYLNGEQQVLLNDENVTALLRSEEVGNYASIVAANENIRKKLVWLQQKLAATENVIMDGRDIGTCVLPDADLKIFLTAASRTRAERRYYELKGKNIECNLDEIENDIIERDKRDMTRTVSPLKQADDAILVDTSDLTIEEVVAHILELFESTKKISK